MTDTVDPAPVLTDKQVVELARDLLKERVFMTDMISENMITAVFPILCFFKPEDVEKMKADGVAHLYEYYNRCGPMSVNGYPVFFSCAMLNKIDHARVRAEWRRLRELIGEPVLLETIKP